MNKSLVSVIIPAYNAEQYIREAIESVLAQTYSPIEVIVVNDGSTDGTADILRQCSDRVTVITQSNGGPSVARNSAIGISRGQWIAFIDADDLWDPTKLEDQFASARSPADVIYCNSRIIDGFGRCMDNSANRKRPGDELSLADLILCNEISILTTVVRRSSLEAVGGFDASNRNGTEDYQLWLRLAATGHRFSYVDKVLASYRVHGANASSNGSLMKRGLVFAVQKTRQEYPGAFAAVERRAYHRALRELHFGIAWHQYDKANYRGASMHFWQAVWHGPSRPGTWLYAVATSLPFRSAVVPRLRGWLAHYRERGRL